MIAIASDDKVINVKLTENEIDLIVDELGRVPHNVFGFMNYDKIVDKLKKVRK